MNKKSENQVKPAIYGTGLIALDVVIGQQEEPPRLWGGGTCGNVLAILSFLGWEAFPIARLGNDVAAQYIKTDFQKLGISWKFMQQEPVAETPIIIQKIKRKADGRVTHHFSWKCPECGAWFPGYKPVLANTASAIAESVKAPKVFFMDRVSRGALNLAKAFSEKGAIIVFEPSGLSDKQLFKEAIELANIVKYSHERFERMDRITSKSLVLEVQTLGKEGIRYKFNAGYSGAGKWRKLQAMGVLDVKDSAGAGDWCTAGILDKIGKSGVKALESLTEKNIEEAMIYGQALAAWNCQFEGARGGMYSQSKEKFYKSVARILEQSRALSEGSVTLSRMEHDITGLCKSCRRTDGKIVHLAPNKRTSLRM